MACLLVVGCGSKDEEPIPSLSGGARDANLLLVTFDTTRPDRLGCYGAASARTPVLDGLAADGVRFERVLAAAPVTLPSHTSLMTGLPPIRHGARDNGLFRADDSLITLAEVLRDGGYRTGAFVSAYVLDSQYGLDQGFDTYDDRLDSVAVGGISQVERSAAGTTNAARAWLSAESGGPWFAWVHFYDPHKPWEAPASFQQGAVDPYAAEITFADAQLGRLLDGLREQGVLDDTVVCVTADHGEGLGEHGEDGHGIFVYDSTMCVPWLMTHPSLPAGRVVGGQCGMIDIFPTLLELLGQPEVDGISGKSQLGVVADATASASEDVYLEALRGWYSSGIAPLESVATDGAKYIAAPNPELYDLEADPSELANRWPEDPSLVAQLQSRMEALREGEDPAPPAPGSTLSAEERQRLAILGYVIGEGPSSEDPPDPKAYVAVEADRARATERLQSGDYPGSEAILRRILDQYPHDAPMRGMLGHILFVTDRHEEAEKEFERVLAQRSDQPGAYFDLAKIHAARGDLTEALECVELTLTYSPDFGQAYALGVRIAEAQGDPELAATYQRRRRERR